MSLRAAGRCIIAVRCNGVQWRNRRGTGGQSAPRDFWPENFCWRIGEKRGKGKWDGWKLRRKEGKLWKGRWKIGNGSRKSYKKRWGPFFFFFAFHFWKRQKFVLGLRKWEFSTGKKHFTPGKKIRKNDFAHSEKYACYAPDGVHTLEQLQQHCINRGLLVREHRMCWTCFGGIFPGGHLYSKVDMMLVPWTYKMDPKQVPLT